MKKVLFLLTVAIAAMQSVQAQVFKQTVTGRNIGQIKSVALSGRLSVEMVRSQGDSIVIDLYDSDLSKLRWEVRKDELLVKLTVGSSNRNGRANVFIYYTKPFDNLSVSGSDVLIRERFNTGMFDVSLVNGAKLTATLDCMDVMLKSSDKSTAMLSGTAKYLTMQIDGKSRIDCRQMESVSVRVTASSGSEAYVWPQERGEFDARSSGMIFYRGEPTIYRETLPAIRFGATIGAIKITDGVYR
ncbi:MAG: DUF2807 domain-containing protein [Rikenellaceae bacterium]|jgi:translation initiation factor IF-1|nr:DUF2807 domain-containing protein [Rikenellaceae bacterium]